VRGRARYRFALTGSSARKLRRSGVNLLAGRAVNRRFHPLCAGELGAEFDLERMLRFGGLPAVWADAPTDAARIDILEAYAENYLTQEVRQEPPANPVHSWPAESFSPGCLRNQRIDHLGPFGQEDQRVDVELVDLIAMIGHEL